MTGFADVAIVVLTCAAAGCNRRREVLPEHVENLTAAGPWRCPDHPDDPQEVTC